LSFGDAKWIARVQLRPSTPETASLLRAEIDAMELVRARTDIPVPRIFGFELDDANPARTAFILMDFLSGSSAMDAEGGYDAHRGEIPPRRKAFFLEQIAKIQVCLFDTQLAQNGAKITVRSNCPRYDCPKLVLLLGVTITTSMLGRSQS
jgi:aminoglycoside phosphotransferase (APT) family kinase protein